MKTLSRKYHIVLCQAPLPTKELETRRVGASVIFVNINSTLIETQKNNTIQIEFSS